MIALVSANLNSNSYIFSVSIGSTQNWKSIYAIHYHPNLVAKCIAIHVHFDLVKGSILSFADSVRTGSHYKAPTLQCDYMRIIVLTVCVCVRVCVWPSAAIGPGSSGRSLANSPYQQTWPLQQDPRLWPGILPYTLTRARNME